MHCSKSLTDATLGAFMRNADYGEFFLPACTDQSQHLNTDGGYLDLIKCQLKNSQKQ